MPNTYKKIATVVVGSGGTASIDFTSIPQTYTDLKIVLSTRGSNANVYSGHKLQFNGSGNTNMSTRHLIGTGTGTSSNSALYLGDASGASSTSNTFGSFEVYIPNYTSSNYKCWSADTVSENNGTEAYQELTAGLWSDTSPITSIRILGDATIVQHSTATLYGIGDVTASKFAKATGGLITYDSTYVYHTFTSSGIFTPNTALTVDYLVVAGGGGGAGSDNNIEGCGGGGAGGYRTGTLSLTSGNKTVTVGAGGSGGDTSTRTASSGVNSVFDSITSTGGGAGSFNTGLSGGSGGGTGRTVGAGGAGNTPSTDPSQGNNGGAGTATGSGGGGGGASSVGSDGSSTTGGNGGAGTTSTITGLSVTYAGGGGGGGTVTGGTTSGGGGTGSNGNANGTAGTVNTGGGGGGASKIRSGGAGGSGIVIIRYTR
jgi:hypothetical protein